MKTIILSILSTFIFVIFVSCSCEQGKVVPSALKDSLNILQQPDQIGWDVTVYFMDSTITKAILKAKRTRVYQQRMETLLDGGLTVDFLSSKTGQRESHLIADSAKIDDRTKNMIAKGNVVVIGDSSHSRLETNLLMWNNQTQKLYSTEYVKIFRPNETIRGFGFESDMNLTNYKIFKPTGEQK